MDWAQVRTHFAACVRRVGAAGHTQARVAAQAGLHQSEISKLLDNDRLGPTVDTFLKAVRGLGMPLSQFFAEIEQAALPADGSPRTRDHATIDPSSSASAEASPADMAHGRPHASQTVSPVRRRQRRVHPDPAHIPAIVAAHLEKLAQEIRREAAVAPRAGADRRAAPTGPVDRRTDRRGRRRTA